MTGYALLNVIRGEMKKKTKKEEREEIYNKFNGRCAYCGKEITYKQMQVDHLQPIFRNDSDENLKNMGRKRGAETLDNLMPSCGRCNRYKSTMTIEQFRAEISKQVARARKASWNFRCAEDFGLISETPKPVTFYFEREKHV